MREREKERKTKTDRDRDRERMERSAREHLNLPADTAAKCSKSLPGHLRALLLASCPELQGNPSLKEAVRCPRACSQLGVSSVVLSHWGYGPQGVGVCP